MEDPRGTCSRYFFHDDLPSAMFDAVLQAPGERACGARYLKHRLCSSYVSLQVRKPIEMKHPVLGPVVMPLAKLGASAPGHHDCFGIVSKFMALLAEKQSPITNAAMQSHDRLLSELFHLWNNSRPKPDVTRTVVRIVFRALTMIKDADSPLLRGPSSMFYFWLLSHLLGYVYFPCCCYLPPYNHALLFVGGFQSLESDSVSKFGKPFKLSFCKWCTRVAAILLDMV